MKSIVLRAILALSLSVLTGCSLMPHSMTPSQMWKMNRQPAWDEGSFSVPDPVDSRLADDSGELAADAAEPPAAEQ